MKNFIIGLIVGALGVYLLNKHLSSQIMDKYALEKEKLEQMLIELEASKKQDSIYYAQKLAVVQSEYTQILDSITHQELKLKEDEKAIINYSGNFNKRFGIFSNLITTNSN